MGIAVGSGMGAGIEVDTGVGSAVGSGVDVHVGNGVAGRIAVGAPSSVATGAGTGDVTAAACGFGSGSPVSPVQLTDISMAETTNRTRTAAIRSSMIASGLAVAKLCLGGNGNIATKFERQILSTCNKAARLAPRTAVISNDYNCLVEPR